MLIHSTGLLDCSSCYGCYHSFLFILLQLDLQKLSAGIFLLVALYCAFDYSATTTSIPVDEDPLNLLQKSELKFLGQVQGPESLAFDPTGRGPYTGCADGRVMFWDGKNWVDFAYSSPNR